MKETYDRLYKVFLAAHPDIEKGYLVLECNAYNARLARLVAEKTAQMVECKCRHIIDGLVKAVTAAVKAGDFAKARVLIRETPQMNDAACDARIYTVRIGLLNSVVNPAQVEPLLAEIQQKEETLLKADKCQELLDWVDGYAFVKDLYADLEASLKALKGATVGLEIAEREKAEFEKVDTPNTEFGPVLFPEPIKAEVKPVTPKVVAVKKGPTPEEIAQEKQRQAAAEAERRRVEAEEAAKRLADAKEDAFAYPRDAEEKKLKSLVLSGFLDKNAWWQKVTAHRRKVDTQ